MWRSLPLISSIFRSRSLSDAVIDLFPFQNSVHGLAGHFFERGGAIHHLDQATAAQRDHAALDGLLLELHRGSSYQDQLADLVIDLHDLVEPAASLVASVIADGAAAAFFWPHFFRLFRRIAGV